MRAGLEVFFGGRTIGVLVLMGTKHAMGTTTVYTTTVIYLITIGISLLINTSPNQLSFFFIYITHHKPKATLTWRVRPPLVGLGGGGGLGRTEVI